MRLPAVAIVPNSLSVGVCLGQPTRAVDLCTLAENIKTFNGQRVRVTGFFGAGAEQDVLYDPKCQDGNALVYVSFKPKVTGQMKALRRIAKKKRIALVTIEGTMRGPEPVRIDPNLPDWLKDRFNASTQRYGHLGSLEMMIEVETVVAANDPDYGLRKAASTTPRN